MNKKVLNQRMVSHISLGVKNLETAGSFYDAVFKPLNYVRIWSSKLGIGYGFEGSNDQFSIFLESETNDKLAAGPGFHLAFNGPSQASVDQSYKAAISLGGKSQFAPKQWPEYSPTYYAAFFWDLDGHRIEIVNQ